MRKNSGNVFLGHLGECSKPAKKSIRTMCHIQSQQKNPLEQCVMFKVNIIGTRTMPGASIVNFEYILHVVKLLLLNLNK